MVRALCIGLSLALGVSILSTVTAGPGDPGTKDSPATDAASKAAKAEEALMFGDFEAAEAGAAAVLKGTPGHGHALFVRGAIKLRRDKAHAEALNDLQAAIKAGYDNVTVRWHAYECRVALKDFEGALGEAEKAAEFAPKSALAKRRVGDAQRLLGRHQDAIKTYGQALALDPGEYMARDGRARVLLDTGDFRGAMADARMLTEVAPSHAGSWELLGRCHTTSKRWAEAAQAFARAVRIEPRMLTAWEKQSLCFMVLEKFDEALPPATRAVELAPSDARLLTNLGLCLLRVGQHREAVRRLNAALICDKPTAYRLELRGECHVALKKYDLAATDFAASLALDRDDLEVYAQYGEALKKLNRFDQALVVLDRLVRDLPVSALFYSERIDVLIEMGRLADAQRAVDEVPEEIAGHWRVLLRRAQLLEKQRRFKEVLALCDKLDSAMPEARLGAIGKAASLAQMGKLDEALAALPESKEPYVQAFRANAQAGVHGMFGRWKEAEELLRDAMSKDMDNMMLLEALGELYLETGQTFAAYRASSRLVSEEPHQVRHWLLQARAYSAHGDAVEEARKCFDRAIEVNAWSADARNGRGYFLMMQGDHAAALPDIQIALELEPHNMPALMNLALIRAADPLGKTAGLEALRKVENEIEHRRKNGGDPLGLRLFSARVCAVRSLMMDPETAAKDRRAALEHLKAYRQSGRVLERDMKVELDLVALHGDPEFQALFEPAEKK